ncbi:MAG: alpha/beta fold hydrolase [Micropepsaceae bacterium]
MIRTFVIALSLVLAGCVAERLQPGPGPAMPAFVDDGHWRASDGFVLGMSQWQVERPRAVIVALHGMNDYGQFIELAAKHWQTRGIATYAYDQRGFGRTDGNGRWPGHEVMAEDARTFAALVRVRHPGVPVYLLGESMGGAVAMVAAAGRIEPIADGLILVSPALWGWSNLDVIKRSALWVMMQIAPGSRLSGRGLNIKPSDNEQMLIALGRDPYVIKATRVDAVHGLTDLMEAAWQSAAAVRVPTMVLYTNGDQVVPSKPTTDAAATIPGAKQVVCYDDGFHMLLRDLKGQRTWDAIEAFIAHGGDAPDVRCSGG